MDYQPITNEQFETMTNKLLVRNPAMAAVNNLAIGEGVAIPMGEWKVKTNPVNYIRSYTRPGRTNKRFRVAMSADMNYICVYRMS